MSAFIQGKVLRVLQEQRFERVGGNEQILTDVRIIAATNRPLEAMVEADEFRKDLLYRLNGFTIPLPPLRERRDDIPLLLEYFMRRAKSEMNRPQLIGISPDALELLNNYSWPGNIRQLQSVVRQSLLNTTGTVIDTVHLPSFIRESLNDVEFALPVTRPLPSNVGLPSSLAPSNPSQSEQEETRSQDPVHSSATHETFAHSAGSGDFSIMQFIEDQLAAGSKNLYAEALEQLERRLFARVLSATDGNQSKAAEILGITRGKVRDRIAVFNIHLDRTVHVGDPIRS